MAGEYERRWSRYLRASTAATLERLPVRPGQRVLDVGCGTGFLIDRLLARCPEAEPVGLDLTPAMLDRAADRLGGRARLLCGSGDALPLPDRSIDALVSANVFHFFDRPGTALAEMRRVLRPGGRIVITDWCDDYIACRVMDRTLRLLGRPHGAVWGSRDCAVALEQSGFHAVRVERFRIGWLWGMMTASAWSA
ncbi:MAG: methyltransferase domain-containing protein [Alphaproteobacteria bacterium]